MPKEKKSKSKIKNREPKYQINEYLLEERGISFSYMIASRLNEIGKVAEEEISPVLFLLKKVRGKY